MERIMSQEERIRRAEEIYFNRRMERRRVEPIPQRSTRKNTSILLKKMMLQIGICSLIYFMVYFIKGNEFAFSSQVIQGMNNFLNEELDKHGRLSKKRLLPFMKK